MGGPGWNIMKTRSGRMEDQTISNISLGILGDEREGQNPVDVPVKVKSVFRT